MISYELDIDRSADDCYRLLCDLARVPEWVPGVADVLTVERDAQSRPTVVRFTAMPARGSLSYLLHYSYDPAARTLCWHSEDRALRDLRGQATVVELDRARCRLRYSLVATSSEELPVWARAVLEEDRPESVARSFRRWVQDRGA
jgi:hypothetical protein